MKLFPRYLDAGSTGAAVIALQLFLDGLALGGDGRRVSITGIYDDKTVRAVQSLQRACGSQDADGNFGPATRQLVNEKYDIDFDDIEGEGVTHYKSPHGDGVWNGVQSRE